MTCSGAEHSLPFDLGLWCEINELRLLTHWLIFKLWSTGWLGAQEICMKMSSIPVFCSIYEISLLPQQQIIVCRLNDIELSALTVFIDHFSSSSNILFSVSALFLLGWFRCLQKLLVFLVFFFATIWSWHVMIYTFLHVFISLIWVGWVYIRKGKKLSWNSKKSEMCELVAVYRIGKPLSNMDLNSLLVIVMMAQATTISMMNKGF